MAVQGIGEVITKTETYVRITFTHEAPTDIITRGQDEAWGEPLYGTMTHHEVLEHWTSNAIRNGVEDVSRLDGWADVPEGAVTFNIDYVEDFEVWND